jgi:hypothetical protein
MGSTPRWPLVAALVALGVLGVIWLLREYAFAHLAG